MDGDSETYTDDETQLLLSDNLACEAMRFEQMRRESSDPIVQHTVNPKHRLNSLIWISKQSLLNRGEGLSLKRSLADCLTVQWWT